MKASERIIQYIKDQEDFRASPYYCPAGILTIGYGHAINKEIFNTPITKEDADRILRLDIKKRESWLNENLRKDIGQNRFDALISIVYNSTNDGNLKRVAPIAFKAIVDGDYDTAAIELFSEEKGLVHMSLKGKKTICKGLINRRIKDKRIWEENE